MGGEVTLKLPFILGHVDDTGLTRTSVSPPSIVEHNCSKLSVTDEITHDDKLAVVAGGEQKLTDGIDNEDEEFCITISEHPLDGIETIVASSSQAKDCVNISKKNNNSNSDILEFNVIDEQQCRSDETSIRLPSMRHNNSGNSGNGSVALEPNINVVTAQVHHHTSAN